MDRNVTFRWGSRDLKKPTLKLQLHLTQQTIDDIKNWNKKGYTIDGLYIYYIINCPKKHWGIEEYDACRMEPGEYKGWLPPRR
jgi:hypothetical protein